MAQEQEISKEQQKTALAERLWLAYFNSYLYEQGVITEKQRNKLKVKIDSRKVSTSYEKHR